MNFLLEKIHSSSLFLSFILGIIFGTILSLALKINFFSSALWLVFILILMIYSFLKPARLFLILIFLAGGILANFRVASELKNESVVESLIGKTLELTGEVSADPSLSGSTTILKLSNLSFANSPDAAPLNASVYVQVSVPSPSVVKRGDFLTLKGELSAGFGTYSASLFRPELLKISRPSANPLLETRDAFANEIKSSLDSDESSLGLAYLLGLRNGLSEELVEILSIVGLTHIVVASGTHLSIIVDFMRKIFGKISRFAGFFFAVLLILVFAELVGWTASITRAAIVSLLSLSAWYVGRKFESVRIILISIGLTLLLDPMNLTNLGWLLSFGSFSGILILAPLLTKFFYGEKTPNLLSTVLLATLSATLMTAPILLYYFGSLSLISIFANLLILPTIPFAMGFTFLTGISGFFFPLHWIVVKITTIILDYHLLVIRFFGSQKVFLLTLPANDPRVFLLYLPLVILILYIEFKKLKRKKSLQKRVPLYFNS